MQTENMDFLSSGFCYIPIESHHDQGWERFKNIL